MHQYLNAIGFGSMKSKKELYEILDKVEQQYTCHELVYQDEELDFCEYQKEFGPGMGICLCGDMDSVDNFTKRYYYPYFLGTGITSYADITIERRMDREAYVGICEDAKIGITIIFYLQNVPQYLKEKQLSGNKMNYTSVTLAGLCESGTILLPVKKDHSQKERQREEVYNRMQLLSAAKSGDPNAIETLTLEDIDTYSKVSRRLVTEDVFSIVDTYIMPYSVECDRYSTLGEIQELHEIVNEYTGENVYVMKLDVNGLVFDVCVPRQGLLGEPAVGRRFKANMWLQGYINY